MADLLSAYEPPKRKRPGRVERSGILLSLSEDGKQAHVDYLGEQFWLPVAPGCFVPGGLVSVLEEAGRPVRVLAALTDHPVNAVEGQAPVQPVVSWKGTALEPVAVPGMTPEETMQVAQALEGLSAAQSKLYEASTLLAGRMDEVDAAFAKAGMKLEELRAGVTASSEAAAAAQSTADAAVSASAAAEQAALKAAGIADSKGKVIYSESEPPGADRVASNLWIQPSTEKTFVWDGAAWDELTSDTVAKAAQDALDARQAAAQAKAAADQAKAEAERALANAAAAQQTADQAILDARGAHNAAVTAQQAADDALAKYGPLDARTIAAQSAADKAARSAAVAQARADAAHSALASTKAELENKIVASANGKNSITYSYYTPSGSGMAVGDVWLRRDASWNVYGQWTWDGSSWRPSMIRSEVIASLDVGKLTAGSAAIKQAVVDKIYAQVITAKLLTAKKIITGTMMADGAVTARTLNVVPESGRGGLQLKPEGMMVIDSEGNGTVDLRVNTENYLSFYKNGATNFSVSADGNLTAQSVSANEKFYYRGTELAEILHRLPRGIVYYAEQINGIFTIQNASYTSRIGHILVERPDTPRFWRIFARAGIQSSTAGGATSSGAHWQFISNYGAWYRDDVKNVHASTLYQMSGYYWQTETLEAVVNTDDILWDGYTNALISWTARNSTGSPYRLGQGAIFYIEDLGPAFDRSPSYPWIRPEEASDTNTSPTQATYSNTWAMAGFQNYLSGSRMGHTSGNIAGGYYGGEWRGIMLFPYSAIQSALSGSTITKVEVFVQNAHTYSSSGSTVLIGSHNYASAPSSSAVLSARASRHFPRGAGYWVDLPTTVGEGFKAGTIKGLGVYGSSTTNYATWVPNATRIRITYKK